MRICLASLESIDAWVQGGDAAASKDAAMEELSKIMVEAKARTDQEGASPAEASAVVLLYHCCNVSLVLMSSSSTS